MTHVEIINPREKLALSLGGTGYLPPNKPVTLAEIDKTIAAFKAAAMPSGMFVLKVSRDSVNWKKHAETRRLKFSDGSCECVVIGSNRDWWFVSVKR